LIAEITEVETGKRADRPKLAAALKLCRVHGATLIIAKLDRLARNVAFVSALMDAGVDFEAVDFPQANRLTIHIMAAVAEHEAKAISDRTKAALASAKARGVSLGGVRKNHKPFTAKARAKGPKVIAARARERAADLAPIVAELRASGVTTLHGISQRTSTQPRAAPADGGRRQSITPSRAGGLNGNRQRRL
jgi:DNA invertase Pin-like site-specific DNA recombinase